MPHSISSLTLLLRSTLDNLNKKFYIATSCNLQLKLTTKKMDSWYRIWFPMQYVSFNIRPFLRIYQVVVLAQRAACLEGSTVRLQGLSTLQPIHTTSIFHQTN
jgi:hypothetical protein